MLLFLLAGTVTAWQEKRLDKQHKDCAAPNKAQQLQAAGTQAINVVLTILLIAVWLGLTAYLDVKPSDTDALQASADNFNDALRDARIAKRDAAREKRHPFTTTTAESQP